MRLAEAAILDTRLLGYTCSHSAQAQPLYIYLQLIYAAWICLVSEGLP